MKRLKQIPRLAYLWLSPYMKAGLGTGFAGHHVTSWFSNIGVNCAEYCGSHMNLMLFHTAYGSASHESLAYISKDTLG